MTRAGGAPNLASTHHNSSQMSALLNPTHGVRDVMRRAGLSPKNHQSANIRRIRELEATNLEKRSAAEGKSADLWSPEKKNLKYEHVVSAVARNLAQKPSPRERPTTAPAKSPRSPSGFNIGRVHDTVRAARRPPQRARPRQAVRALSAALRAPRPGPSTARRSPST